MKAPNSLNSQFLTETGSISRFAARFFRELFKRRQEWEEFLRQCYWVGYKSLPLVAITAFIMGLVMTIQSRPTLVEFGAEALLPARSEE
ncbi:MAG: ABC transporter permease, partial [Imperialibacter sp.]